MPDSQAQRLNKGFTLIRLLSTRDLDGNFEDGGQDDSSDDVKKEENIIISLFWNVGLKIKESSIYHLQ